MGKNRSCYHYVKKLLCALVFLFGSGIAVLSFAGCDTVVDHNQDGIEDGKEDEAAEEAGKYGYSFPSSVVSNRESGL